LVKHFSKVALAALAVAVASIGVGAGTASATPVPITYTADYFTVTPGSPPSGDFNTECCYGPVVDVENTLVGGLPAWNGVGPIKDTVGGVGTAIEWWTPGTYNGDVVASDGTGSAMNPYANGAFFPPKGTGTSDAPSLQTAIFTGSFSLATKSNVVFDLGADDDAYLYVDGNLVEGLGGVHPNDVLPTDAVVLSAGSHSIELFYADRNVVAASLNFSLDSTGITPTVPEPSTWAMMLLGFAGLGFAGYRKAKGGVALVS
jgi:fibro-slime domain-containing protein